MPARKTHLHCPACGAPLEVKVYGDGAVALSAPLPSPILKTGLIRVIERRGE